MVSLINISNQIGEIADLYTCCRSNKINPNSFKKPINNASLTELDIQDYYDANDGFTLFTFNTPQRMIYELQHPNASNIWKYEARTAPYRLTDFENYNHYATPLCNLTFETDNGGTPGSSLRLSCTDFTNIIQHWQYFEGVRSYVYIVLLFYTYGTEFDQSDMQSVNVYYIGSMVDYDGDGNLNFRIPSGLSNGQYEIRLAMTTVPGEAGDVRTCNVNNPMNGTWYAMPESCKQVFTVNSGGGGSGGGSGGGGSTSTDYYNYLEIDFYNAQYEYNALQLGNISFTNYIVLNSATNKTFEVYVEYYYDNSAMPIQLGWARRTLSEDGMPWATININYKDSFTTITDANLDDRIAIRAEFTVTVNGTSQRKTINTTIQRE